jgi:nicotinate-nucleotide pyrophosphorylase (carboxylating)
MHINLKQLKVRHLLHADLLQRMSGIATATAAMVKEAQGSKILETRKTVPGLRMLDKWAVLIGEWLL